MSIALSVNLNKIALLRNSRDGNYPNLKSFADYCVASKVQGLTAHPRPDQRHIRVEDVPMLSETAKKAGIEFNIEGNPFADATGSYPGLMELIREAAPHQCTFVPDSDEQLTSDHGFDLKKDGSKVEKLVAQSKALGVRVSLFMDPDVEQIRLAKEIGADRIELYTGPFAWAFEKGESEGRQVFDKHCEAAEAAISAGLGVNAGHDLNLHNMQMYNSLPGLKEVSIGHALTVDSLLMGFDKAICAYLEVCNKD